jgi:hypothetical protein
MFLAWEKGISHFFWISHNWVYALHCFNWQVMLLSETDLLISAHGAQMTGTSSSWTGTVASWSSTLWTVGKGQRAGSSCSGGWQVARGCGTRAPNGIPQATHALTVTQTSSAATRTDRLGWPRPTFPSSPPKSSTLQGAQDGHHRESFSPFLTTNSQIKRVQKIINESWRRFFFETEAKDLPHPLIKKKRSQLINGKPGEKPSQNRWATHMLDNPHTTHEGGPRRDRTQASLSSLLP